MARALRNMGGVKCQPFQKHSNHWKRTLQQILKGSVCFSYCLGFSFLVLLLPRKKAYALPQHGSLIDFAVSGIETPHSTVTDFSKLS